MAPAFYILLNVGPLYDFAFSQGSIKVFAYEKAGECFYGLLVSPPEKNKTELHQ